MRPRNPLARVFLAATLAIIGLETTLPAQAVPITEGTTVPLTGTTHPSRPELGGSVVVDQQIPVEINLGSAGRFSGWLQNRVVREAAGNLTFYYRLRSDSTSTLAPDAVTDYLTLPASRSADMDFRIDGMGTVPPTTADRDPGRLVFRFATPVGPGQESRFFFLRTDATDYALNTETMVTGESGQVAYMRSVPTWGPVYPAGKLSSKK